MELVSNGQEYHEMTSDGAGTCSCSYMRDTCVTIMWNEQVEAELLKLSPEVNFDGIPHKDNRIGWLLPSLSEPWREKMKSRE